MLDALTGLFDTAGFTSRKESGTGWTAPLIALHAIADLFIGLAFVAILLVLVYFTRRRELPFPRLFVLFALFILACGTTHLVEALTFEYPIHRFAGVMKLITAVLSWATVIALVAVIPRVRNAVPEASQPGADPLPSTDRLKVEEDQKRLTEILEDKVRKRTAALVAEQNFLDAILSNMTEGVVACDESGALTLFNRAAQKFHGLPVEPLSPDQWAGRYDLFHADGETPFTTEEVPLFRALHGERVRDVEMVIAPRGQPPLALLANGQRLTDLDGRILGAVVSMRDVTDQREADRQLREVDGELRRANTELKRSNDELEKFAYVASHDLQEPLRKIQAFGDRLRDRCREQLPEQGQEYIDRMLTAASRMRRLIDDLLTFSRVTSQQRPFQSLDLGKLVREVAIDLEVTITQAGGSVRVGELPAIDADPSQMRQLFQNLIGNAVKFKRPGVPPVVEIESELLSEPSADPKTGEPIAMCRVTVRDNGIGLDEKYRDRIFEVFQRLHGRDEYEGTGVGLAICRKIVERHGGSITVNSRVGAGSTFVVTLPMQQSHTQESA